MKPHIFDKALGLMSEYLRDRDPMMLREAASLLLQESETPSLQEAIITLPWTADEAFKHFQEGFLRFSLADAEATAPVGVGKYVRVQAKEQSEDLGPALMFVAHMDSASDGAIVLVAVEQG